MKAYRIDVLGYSSEIDELEVESLGRDFAVLSDGGRLARRCVTHRIYGSSEKAREALVKLIAEQIGVWRLQAMSLEKEIARLRGNYRVLAGKGLD
jgi:hypothetical protein